MMRAVPPSDRTGNADGALVGGAVLVVVVVVPGVVTGTVGCGAICGGGTTGSPPIP
jgi:hypothetical protein